MGNKMVVAIYGMGLMFPVVYHSIDKKTAEVRCIIDNDPLKNGTYFEGIRIVSSNMADAAGIDYVVVSSDKYFSEIKESCIKIGFQDEKIFNFWRPAGDASFICRSDEIERLVKENTVFHARLNNMKYEISPPVYTVKSAEELLNRIITDRSSLARFGDSEFDLMLNHPRPWYQQPNDELSIRLKEIIKDQADGLILAISDNFGNLDKYTEYIADSIRIYNDYGKRETITEYLETKRIYYDAYVTRPYFVFQDKNIAKRVFGLFKQIFFERDILMVEGTESRFGVGNDLLSGARSVRRIRCPMKDAFSVYQQIYETVCDKSTKDTLILISLGATATVLAYDLTKRKHRQAIDIGQLDNEYDWYLMGKGGRVPIEGKATAEGTGSRYAAPPDKKYLSEVVATVI